MATALQSDLRARDALVFRSGSVAARCAPGGPGALARALGKNPAQGTRAIQGDRYSAFYRALELTELLSRGVDTTAAPLLAEQQVIMTQVHLGERSTETLIRRFHELQDRELFAEAEEKRASRGGSLETYADRLVDEAALQLELAATIRELARRGVDPRRYRGDGWPLRNGTA